MTDTGAEYYHRFLQGDRPAIEELVRMYGDSLTRFAYCFVKDASAAEDIMADTFATLLVKRKKLNGGALFKTYLYRIARNKAIDFLRAHKRIVPLDDLEAVLCCGSVEHDLSEQEQTETLYRCMQSLPPQYKDVLYLHYIDGFTVAELCDILKKNPKQVYNLLARAKPALKEILIKEGVSYEIR